jgi:hypothetical protein
MAEELGITGRAKLLEQLLLVDKSAKIQQQNNEAVARMLRIRWW